MALLLPLCAAAGARADDGQRPAWIGPAKAQAQSIHIAPFMRQAAPAIIPAFEIDADPAGLLGNFMPAGPVLTANQSFFDTSITANGRSCFTCHQPQTDWSFTPAGARQRFWASNGTDPLFQPVDGANCPNTPTLHSLLLDQGLNRIFIAPAPPPDAEFTILVASDPTNCETGIYGLGATPTPGLSVYRRPLPASNLIFLNLTNVSPALHCNPTPVPNNGTPNQVYKQAMGTTGYTGSMTAGSDVLTLNSAPANAPNGYLFVAQPVIVVGAGTANPNGGETDLLVTTVVSVIDALDYVLADPATNTVSGVAVNNGAINSGNAGPTKQPTPGELGISENCENIMWDGREPDLRSQFIDATQFHGQSLLTATTLEAAAEQGVLFQQGIYTAQSYDNLAHNLRALGANGGPLPLPGLYPDSQPGGTATFDIFTAWASLPGPSNPTTSQRESIARGQFIFNNVNIALTGVAGFNNTIGPGEGKGNGFIASCNTCHSVGDVGAEILLHLVNTGVAYAATNGQFGMTKQTSLPQFKLICTAGVACQPTAPGQVCYDDTQSGVRPPYPPKQGSTNLGQVCTPEAPCTVVVDDPGAALISGSCDDIGAFVTPALRGIGARPPFFHDGSAPTLADVVNFYNHRFYMCMPTTSGGTCTPGTGHLSSQQTEDLVNFLSAL